MAHGQTQIHSKNRNRPPPDRSWSSVAPTDHRASPSRSEECARREGRAFACATASVGASPRFSLNLWTKLILTLKKNDEKSHDKTARKPYGNVGFVFDAQLCSVRFASCFFTGYCATHASPRQFEARSAYARTRHRRYVSRAVAPLVHSRLLARAAARNRGPARRSHARVRAPRSVSRSRFSMPARAFYSPQRRARVTHSRRGAGEARSLSRMRALG